MRTQPIARLHPLGAASTLRRPKPMSNPSAAKPASTVRVPLLDLKAQYREIEGEVLDVLKSVCASQMFILGPHVEAIEKQVAAYSQSAHGIGMSSGTDALLAALMAFDIGPGDAVITSPYTFFASAGVVSRLGARPIFVDIEPGTFNLDPKRLEEWIQKRGELRGGALVERSSGARVKALMPVHLYGQMADMDALMEIARRSGMRVIEDACQAIGSEDARGRRAGSIGDVGCFSFFPTKNLGGFGDGGLCTTNDAALAEKLRIIRVHGMKPKYYHSLVGANFRLDEIQAAVLAVKMKRLDAWTAGRQANARFYDAAWKARGLEKAITAPVVQPGRHVFNQYAIRSKGRDALRERLTALGVGTEIYYPVSLHEQECFRSLGYKPEDLPESHRAAQESLALPIYPELTDAQKAHVVDSIAAAG